MPIELLSPDVIAKIAAGEVVERPASVVKELVENSLDAGASAIHAEIAVGGVDLILVADDGMGIEKDELPLAIQRHATSKIRQAEDLSRVTTLGFRGEALGSISAVSQFSILSRASASQTGYRLVVEGGSIFPLEAAARAPGTTVVVERLFYNVPARRKFLRSAASEAGQVIQTLSQLALAYPAVAFDLLVDGRKVLVTPGTGDFMEAALAVLGKDVARALQPVEAAAEVDRPSPGVAARIEGYAAGAQVSRSSRSSIWLFVNRRAVKSRSLSFAVEEGYQTLLQVGRHPIAVINLQVPPSEVDVNVHPTKSEVRLLHERLIYGVLRDAVRGAVAGKSDWGKAVSGLTEEIWPAAMEPQLPSAVAPRLIDAPIASGQVDQSAEPSGGGKLPILRLMGQVGQTYIVAEGEKGLYLIDQHAAHERVLLDRLTKSLDREGNTQLLLEPAVLELTPSQMETARAAGATLEALGYRLEPFGDATVLVRGLPTELPQGRAMAALEESLEELAEEKPGPDWKERITISLSCRSAVKAGQTLSLLEMKTLLEALEEAGITQHCSHGRPTAILLSHTQMEKEFGRR